MTQQQSAETKSNSMFFKRSDVKPIREVPSFSNMGNMLANPFFNHLKADGEYSP
jgi:hypothetical protein